MKLFLLPIGYHTERAPYILTRNGREQMFLAAEKIAVRLCTQLPFLVCPPFEPGYQARRIVADRLQVPMSEETKLFEDFSFLLSYPDSIRLTVEYIAARYTTPGNMVLLVNATSIRELQPALERLYWRRTGELIRCEPKHFLLFDPEAGGVSLH